MPRHKQKRDEAAAAKPEELLNNPFRELAPEDFPKAETVPEPPPPAARFAALLGNVLELRLERKGRRGKTVTVVTGLPADKDDLVMALGAELRRCLGAGGTFYGDTLEFQGDQRQRVAAWLQAQGFIVRGNLGGKGAGG